MRLLSDNTVYAGDKLVAEVVSELITTSDQEKLIIGIEVYLNGISMI